MHNIERLILFIEQHIWASVLLFVIVSTLLDKIITMAKGFMDGYKTYDTEQGFGSRRKWKQSFRETISPEDAANIMAAQDDTPHGILGIKTNASQEEIKTAFKNKMKEWHPDFNPTQIEKSTIMAQRINAAYTLLKK